MFSFFIINVLNFKSETNIYIIRENKQLRINDNKFDVSFRKIDRDTIITYFFYFINNINEWN